MANKKSIEGITVKKNENFSEWFTQIVDKAELVDMRNGVKGFTIIRPWAALTMENMFEHLEKELQKKDINQLLCQVLFLKRI